jgi:hypothetical protein
MKRSHSWKPLAPALREKERKKCRKCGIMVRERKHPHGARGSYTEYKRGTEPWLPIARNDWRVPPCTIKTCSTCGGKGWVDDE